MTNREALIALRDAVVAGQWDHSTAGAARQVFPYRSARIDDLGLTAVEAFNGSVDAAIALLEAVLPGWSWLREDTLSIRIFGPDNGDYYPSAKASGITPARALLIATLNAMIANSERG